MTIRLKQVLLALWKWVATPIDNPWMALGLALVGAVGLLLLLKYLAPLLQQFPLLAP